MVFIRGGLDYSFCDIQRQNSRPILKSPKLKEEIKVNMAHIKTKRLNNMEEEREIRSIR